MARTRLVQIINRTMGPLDCMFDGVPEVIKPGYKLGMVPKLDKNGDPVVKDGAIQMIPGAVGAGRDEQPDEQTVEFAAAEAYVRQHPIMGTSDPNSVDARDTEYLLGVPAWGHDVFPTEQTDADELIDRSLLPDDRQNVKRISVKGKRRSASRSAIVGRKIAENKRRAGMDAGYNPNGIKLSGGA